MELRQYWNIIRRRGWIVLAIVAVVLAVSLLTLGVLVAAGLPVRYFPEVAPTPLVAYAARVLGATAAVVVTASHNPPGENGYKVYDANGAQLIPPVDAGIAAAIERVGPAAGVPRVEGALEGADGLARPVEAGLVSRYVEEVLGLRPQLPADRLRPAPQSLPAAV